MTVRDIYEYALVELNKLNAPSLLLEDYNYFINKAIQQYINLVYAKSEIDQQSTDDIRVLKTSAVLEPKLFSSSLTSDKTKLLSNGLFKTSYYADLPTDYMHLLNCIVEYTIQQSNFKCYNKGDTVHFPVRRLTSDMYTQILNNAYMRPMYKRPYYYLSAINTNTVAQSEGDRLYNKPGSFTKMNANDLPTKEGEKALAREKVAKPENESQENTSYDLIDSEAQVGNRLSNSSAVRLELRFGNDATIFKPTALYIDYIKSPMYVRLTQEQIDSTIDYSQVLEFPDYVCFEITNIFVRLLMENSSDPRLQTNIPLNTTIYNPVAQQQQQQTENNK